MSGLYDGPMTEQERNGRLLAHGGRGNTSVGGPPPVVAPPTPPPVVQDPSAFTPTLPQLGPPPGGAGPGPGPGPGSGMGPGGGFALLNPYMLYLPQGRADAATAITGIPGMGGLIGGGS